MRQKQAFVRVGDVKLSGFQALPCKQTRKWPTELVGVAADEHTSELDEAALTRQEILPIWSCKTACSDRRLQRDKQGAAAL